MLELYCPCSAKNTELGELDLLENANQTPRLLSHPISAELRLDILVDCIQDQHLE